MTKRETNKESKIKIFMTKKKNVRVSQMITRVKFI
jgi:hypothetical protein